ncbi:MAG TPA: hypothetical protein VFV01_04630, partial [Spirillospora sp.]|nr:hypothetical protein [Spirillospora sp.]
MNDVPKEPEPADRPEDAEHEPGRTATAEFRIPAPAPAKNASLTRPDIRRPAKPAEDDAEPAPEEEADAPAPEEDESPEETSEQEAETESVDADAEESAEEAPENADAEEEEPETEASEEGAESAASPGLEQGPDDEVAQDAADEPEDEPDAEERPEAPRGVAEAPAPAPWAGPPAAVTRVERLPVSWEAPAPGSDAAQGPAAPARPGGQEWWETPHQAPASAAWEAQRQAPAGEFRPESVRWDAPPQQGAAQQGAPQQGAAVPVRPVQSGPWEVAAPQAPAPPQPIAEAERRPKRRRLAIVLVAALVLVVGVVAGQLIRPVPDPTVKLRLASSHVFQGAAPTLPWPAVGQSTVYVDGLGTMGASGGAAPTPTASVAKVMTAFVYLRDHPLKTGEAGPVLAVSPQGVAEIPARKKRGESLLGITAGQRLTERKALEALLIISANDLAHELARWDSGGDQPFVAKMNAAARELGMTSTRYTDPSGYDSGTVSTAADQVKLLRAAMRVPAFTEIVNRRAYVPDDGSPARPGGNVLVGQYGVVGGKTGYTDAAGGNFVFAARKRVGGVPTLILGAVMAQKSPSAQGAVEAAGRLIQAVEGSMTAATLAPKGARVGTVDDGLGGTTPLRAASPVTVVGWPGLRVPVGIQGDPPHRGGAGERVGEV